MRAYLRGRLGQYQRPRDPAGQQELGIRQGRATTTYFDSASTVFVAKVDVVAKQSEWLERRRIVLTQTVAHGKIDPVHIGEADMVADSNTKYIKHETWARHMH